jgi:threonine/homoserine/homoserine lactone efflux protein
MLAAFASTLGIVPHLIAAISGLAAVLHASAVAFEIIRYLGVAYLLYMAWATLRDTGSLRIAADGPRRSVARVLVDGVVLNLLNPKLSIFFFAFLPQFVTAGSVDAVPRMLELSGIFMLATFGVFAIYVVRCRGERPYRRPTGDHDLDAPFLRRGFRRAFGPAGLHGPIGSRASAGRFPARA